MSSLKKLLDWSQRETETFHWDQHENQFTVQHQEDVEPLIEAAKDMSYLEPGKDLRHAAFIPKFVLNQAFREGWFNDRKAWKKWANQPENKAFRTWPGQL